MNTDWMGLFLAGLIGFSVGWLLCSLWAVRMMDEHRRRMRETKQTLDDYIRNVEPMDTPLMRHLKQAKEIEELFK